MVYGVDDETDDVMFGVESAVAAAAAGDDETTW